MGEVFVVVKMAPGILPFPLVGCDVEIPAGEFLAQANVVKGTELENEIRALEVPEQIDWAEGVAVTSGIGSTVNGIQADAIGPQPTPVCVI